MTTGTALQAPGIYEDVSFDEYLSIKALSSSIAWSAYSQSPLHARTQLANPSKASTVMDIGSAAHELLLENGRTRVVCIEFPDWRKKEAQEQRDEAKKSGMVPVLRKSYDHITAMRDAALDFIEISELRGVFDTGGPEQTVLWDGGELHGDPLPMKARPDWLTADRSILLHYKTADSAKPESFIRTHIQYGAYGLTWAFYDLAMRSQGLTPLSVFFVQETEPPYACSLVSLDPSMQAIAHGQCARAIEIWRRCVQSGKYPAYSTRINYAAATPWQLADEEEKATEWLSNEELENGVPA